MTIERAQNKADIILHQSQSYNEKWCLLLTLFTVTKCWCLQSWTVVEQSLADYREVSKHWKKVTIREIKAKWCLWPPHRSTGSILGPSDYPEPLYSASCCYTSFSKWCVFTSFSKYRQNQIRPKCWVKDCYNSDVFGLKSVTDLKSDYKLDAAGNERS